MSANERQVAGGHYVKYGTFQVWDAWWHWKLDPFQVNILKYIVRTKGDLAKRFEDLDKALHYLEKYKELLIADNVVDLQCVTRHHLEDTALPYSEAIKRWDLDIFQVLIMDRVVCSDQRLEDRLHQLQAAIDGIGLYKEHLSAKENDNDK